MSKANWDRFPRRRRRRYVLRSERSYRRVLAGFGVVGVVVAGLALCAFLLELARYA